MPEDYLYDLKVFGVRRINHGWIYMIRSNGIYKFGTTKNPKRRLNKDANTWLPDMEIIGIKPFYNAKAIERKLHIGLSTEWYKGEWFCFSHEDLEQEIIEGFSEFYDNDPEKNSVDFIYWFSSTGMSELAMEKFRRPCSLPVFQRDVSFTKKKSS